jgi:type IV pilus assembly protein PilY1
MMDYCKHICWITIGTAITLGSVSPGYADDTELFFPDPNAVISSGALNANPNVLFILDTSGSMRGEVITQASWDPNVTWSGDYRSDAVYWAQFGGEPSSDSNNWYYQTANHCAASLTAANSNLNTTGVYQDNFAVWRANRNRWRSLNRRHSWKIDCEADAGIHGQGTNGTETDPTKQFIANGNNGPWAAAQNYTFNNQYTLYSGNYLNWKNSGGTVVGTRMEIVQETTKNLLDNLTGINVGLMRFNNSEGGPVLHELAPIDTARASIKSAIDSMNASGWTPLSETLYEAGQYYAGRAVDYGNRDSSQLSVAESRVGNNINATDYDSPIEFSCQRNYIVMLTDGAPTQDSGGNNKIANLPGFQAATGQGSCSGNCLDEMAGYLNNHDLSAHTGGQEVISHFIGFNTDLALLNDAATAGGGEYKLATDTASLSITLTVLILNIFDDSTSFTAPSVPVNSFNRMQNLNDVFVSVFEPNNQMHWPGNMKKYRLKGGVLTGVDGMPVVDANTGFFSNSPPAHSYWSTAPDGDDVTLGGAAENLPTWQTRSIYTNLTGTQNIVLNNGSNDISVASSVTSIELGINSDPNNQVLRSQVIEWALGRDIWDDDTDGLDTDDRNAIGAPLHSAPVTMIYGGTENNPEALVFTATNDGYLHAFDTRTGVEEWSFIPHELLDRVYGLYLNEETPNVSYGLDGQITAYIKNNDFLPGIDPSTETAYLIFGMRRGGQSLFALDVTHRNDPRLLWIVDPNSSPALADLGQTWSDATVSKIDINGTTKHVVMIGGGYDTGQDANGYFEDTVGNAIYMIDLDSGSVVWSAGDNDNHDLVMNMSSNAEANATMKHSIPAPVRGIDLTGNGYVDRIYAGDMGGRIWRFDVFNGAANASELVGGGLLATLGAADLGAPATADVRRFYAVADIVPILAVNEYEKSYISVNIGSGYRAHPLETENDNWFFSVRDFDFFQKRTTSEFDAPITFGDLIDITTFDPQAVPLLNTDLGWRLALEAASGEKVVSSSLTLDGTVFFTSFSPTPPSNSCTEAVHGGGTNRLYRVSVLNGNPAPHPDDLPLAPAEMTAADRFEELNQGGLAPGPVAFFTVDAPDPNNPPDPDECDPATQNCVGEPDICIGPACFPSGIGNGFIPTYWFQNETQ